MRRAKVATSDTVGLSQAHMPNDIVIYFPSELQDAHFNALIDEPEEYMDVSVSLGDHAMQIGAAEGYFGKRVLRRASKVYLVEPLPYWQAALSKTFEKEIIDGRATLLQLALSSKDGRSKFLVLNDWLAGSHLIEDQRQIEDAIDVDVSTLDKLVQQEKMERLDFIKIDAEGAELSILQGGLHTLQTFKPKLVLETNHRIEDTADIVALLQGLRYRVYLRKFGIGFERKTAPYCFPHWLYAVHSEAS
jgi:FkbM family methyltransferase